MNDLIRIVLKDYEIGINKSNILFQEYIFTNGVVAGCTNFILLRCYVTDGHA